MAKRTNKKRPREQDGQHKSHKLHDEFVKKNLRDKTMSQDLVRQFIPEEIVKHLNLSEIELDTNEYITDELAKYYSDTVWICPYRGNKIRVAILLEHKSSPSAYPHFQLLRYMLEIWEKNLYNEEPFLPIIPIILFHGEGKWNNRPMAEYFEGIGPELLRYIPQFNYELINLGQYSAEQITAFKVGLLKNVLLALRYSRDEDYLRKNFGLLFVETEECIETTTGTNFIKTMLVYLLKNTEFSDLEIDDMVKQIPSPINNLAMSSYDVLIHKGLRQGIEQGIEKEKIEVIKNARLNGLSIEIISNIVNLPQKKVREILNNLGIN
jgi:predicted transposase/invertase (TIGR01784 family)